ncbi:mpv17-like protein, partial [Panicum virgatum]|uniref:mpv17-like protein n=1 Tax=Panicum virgatum TaxID=38727 RepID=UPI0019D66E45
SIRICCFLQDKDKAKEFKVDWRRVGITSSFGFAFVGPVGHYWYEYLDRFIRQRFQPNTFKFVASKVAADGFLFGPLDLLLFFSYVGLGQGRSVEQVKEDVKRDFIPALVLGGMIWPAVQIVNFRFIPVRYQLLYVNLFCLLDSCFLSWIEQQGDASWKQWFTSFHKIEDQKSKV